MKLIYTDQNRMLVEHMRNVVENADIDVLVKNEWTAGAAGELAPSGAWLELWVLAESDEPRARALIEAVQVADDGPNRRCPDCREECPASFALCWNCEAVLTAD